MSDFLGIDSRDGMGGFIQDQKKDPEWIEIFPYGVTIGADESRPVLIFKDKTEKQVLPVWINPQEAHIAMTQVAGRRITQSPHTLAFRFLKESQVVVEKCHFVKIQGHHQFIDVHFKTKRGSKVLEARAGDVMSFCLHSKARFYCTIDHMIQSRQLNMEIDHLASQRTAGDVNVVFDGDDRYMN